MHLKNLVPADMSEADLRLLERTPKAVLFAIAKHLAARCDEGGSYDHAIVAGSYRQTMVDEWLALHAAGIVQQRPPKTVTDVSKQCLTANLVCV